MFQTLKSPTIIYNYVTIITTTWAFTLLKTNYIKHKSTIYYSPLYFRLYYERILNLYKVNKTQSLIIVTPLCYFKLNNFTIQQQNTVFLTLKTRYPRTSYNNNIMIICALLHKNEMSWLFSSQMFTLEIVTYLPNYIQMYILIQWVSLIEKNLNINCIETFRISLKITRLHSACR